MKAWFWRILGVAVLLYLAVGPLVGMERSTTSTMWYIFFYATLASAWNILGGFAGQVSFGYSAFVGLGAYTTGLLWLAGWNPYLTLPLAGLTAAVFSAVVGYPTFRLRGPFFTIATIGVSEVMRVLMLGMEWTGGSSGKTLPTPKVFSDLPNYYSGLTLAVATLLVVWLIQRSRFGLALASIKQDIDAAESLGVNATWYKLAAHGVSAFIAGVAGGLYAQQIYFIDPNAVFAFNLSLSMVLMPVIGGIGTFWGPVIGGVIFSYIQQEVLATFKDFHLLVYGMLLILIMMFEPLGLIGLYNRLRRLGRRQTPRAATSEVTGR